MNENQNTSINISICKQCAHVDNFYGYLECDYPLNRKSCHVTGGYSRSKPCSEININGNCKWFTLSTRKKPLLERIFGD